MKKTILLFTAFICFLNFSFGQAGRLDSSFGTNGIVKSAVGVVYDLNSSGSQVLVQKDGSIFIITKTDYPINERQTQIAKRHADGSADLSYGTKGLSVGVTFRVTCAGLQPDGKIIVAGYAPGGYVYDEYGARQAYDFVVARFDTMGNLDNTFTGDGIQFYDLFYSDETATALAIQSDGKIVVAGYMEGSEFSGVVMRINSDGSLDDTFNNRGYLKTSFGNERNLQDIESVALQSDGKIVAGGYSENTAVLARFNTDGSPDSTFNGTGYATIDSVSSVKHIAIQGDGKIVAAGISLARININGSLDKTFSGNGIYTADFSITSIAIQPGNKIVVAGNSNDSSFISRYNTNGSLDNTFSNNSIQGTQFPANLVIAKGGKIVAGGSITENDFTNFAIARYNINGAPDNTLDGDGVVRDHIRQPENTFYSTAVQADGKIIAGNAKALVRYNTNGSLDNSFGKDGVQVTGYAITSIKIQKDSKIVAAGGATFARYNTDGSADNTFSGDGKQTTDFAINRLFIANDGKIVVGGGSYIARYNSNGSPDNSFDTDGKITVPAPLDYFADIAVQNDGKIVAVNNYNLRQSTSGGFLLTRFNTNGSLDNTFGKDGIQYSDFDPYDGGEVNFSADLLAIQNNGKIIVAGSSYYAAGPYYFTFVLARYNTDGSLDSSFAHDGVNLGYDGGGNLLSKNNTIAIQDDDKIVIGGRAGKEKKDFALVRYNNDGLPDDAFGESGTQITKVSEGDNEILSIAITGNKLYAVGYGSFPGNVGIAARYLLGNENKAPSVTLSTPFVKYTAPASIKLNAKATDTDGTITKVEFYNGTTLLHTEHVIPYGYWFTHVPVGNYTLTAKAYDNSGNVTTSNAIEVSVVNYNVPPVVSIAKPADNQTYGAHASVRLIAKANDANDTISKVEFFSNNKLIRTEYYSPYTYWWDNVQPGTYTITAVATDAKGLSSTSAPVHITVLPNEAPTVSIITPANHQTFTGPATIHLEATAKDMDGTIHKVEFYNGNTLLRTEYKAPYTYTWKDVPVGNYTITAKAFDNQAAPATSVVNISVVPSQLVMSSRPSSADSKTGENNSISISLYPNPASNILNIYTKGLLLNKPSTISVLSASGVVVKTMQSNTSNKVVQLDVSSLVSGVYTMKIMSGDKVLYKKFVKL